MTEFFTKEEAELVLLNAGIPVINPDTNYWFIRTNAGENFRSFYLGKYVALGWDEINDLEYIKSNDASQLKQDVAKKYPEESKPGSIASQLLRFVVEMKVGDYVVIPSANCDELAFGVITGDAYLYEPTKDELFRAQINEEELDFFKRRNVEWITKTPLKRNEVDPMLIPIIYSYGTIVDANPYSTFINRSVYDIYYRDGALHTIFDITRTDDIPAYEFNSFIGSIFKTIDLYSEITEIPVDKKDLSIKTTINSAGPVELITNATSMFIILAAIGLLINGAKVKFDFNIFNIASGSVDINSPGLADRANKLIKTLTDSKVKLDQSEQDLLVSKTALEIEKKKHKK